VAAGGERGDEEEFFDRESGDGGANEGFAGVAVDGVCAGGAAFTACSCLGEGG